ncbi:MAG: TadE family protein [Pseudomonadota bacterium]
MILRLARELRRFRRREDGGTSTVEFVILFPAFLAIFLSSFESGLMMVRNVMLERAVDLNVRQLRLGTPAPPSYDQFKAQVCADALIIVDCESLIQVQLEPISTATWVFPTNDTFCIDEARHNDPANPMNPLDDTTYVGGGNNEMLIVRVCALFTPMFPGTALGMQMPKFDPTNPNDDAKYALVVTSAFVNEPTRPET